MINASIIEDRDRFARVALYCEERTGYMLSHTLHENRQMEDFIEGAREMIALIRAGTHEEPKFIRLRSTMYPDRSRIMRDFLENDEIEMVTD